MISKKIYVVTVASCISILAITDFVSIVFGNYFLGNHIDQNAIKYILLFFIPVMELSYTKKFPLEVVGWITSSVIYMIFLFNITHWFQTSTLNIITIIAFVTLLLIFTKNHTDHKKIRYFNLLFQVFFFTRVIVILSKPNEVLWWIDQFICFAVLMVSVVYLSTYIKNRFVE